jgi:hypothetical protein
MQPVAMHQGKQSEQIEIIVFRIDAKSPKSLAGADPANHSDGASLHTQDI